MIDINVIWAGIALAATGGIIYSLKAIPNKIWQRVRRNMIYTVKIYQYDDLFNILENYMFSKYKQKYKDVEASYGDNYNSGISQVIEAKPKTAKIDDIIIKYKQEETTFVVKWEGKNLLVTKNKEKLDKAQNLKDIYFRQYHITGFRAKKAIDSLLKAAIDYSLIDKEKNIVKISPSTMYGDWLSPNDIRVKNIEKTILNTEVKSLIIDDINEFLSKEEWYINAGIPYKRGICLYGPPGTGKTTLALAIANYTNRRVYCLSMNSLENDTRMYQAFAGMNDNAILLIEDIDKIFCGRDNVDGTAKITFSSFLNCMDGALYKHGVITIITTNHFDKLDEALLRTGRVDLKIEVPLPTEKEISEYLSIFYNKSDLKVVGDFSLKMSDIQEICLQNKNNYKNAIKQIENEKIRRLDIHVQQPYKKLASS